jgi:hypothetical protein
MRGKETKDDFSPFQSLWLFETDNCFLLITVVKFNVDRLPELYYHKSKSSIFDNLIPRKSDKYQNKADDRMNKSQEILRVLLKFVNENVSHLSFSIFLM